MYAAGRGGSVKVHISITLMRADEAQFSPGQRSFARLVVGSPSQDQLLLCESVVLEEFQSPLTRQLDCVTTSTGELGLGSLCTSAWSVTLHV